MSDHHNILDNGRVRLLAACAYVRYRYVLAQAQDGDRYKLYYGKQCESVGTAGGEIFYDLPINIQKAASTIRRPTSM
ncbi:MAG: hypothetical protein LC775_16545 [Acidobacteria bacterium]|nr:hypothetical protein [Acidobacteriota bacterium]